MGNELVKTTKSVTTRWTPISNILNIVAVKKTFSRHVHHCKVRNIEEWVKGLRLLDVLANGTFDTLICCHD